MDVQKIWLKFINGLKGHFMEVIKTKTSDHSVAMGFALGSFIAILPTPGISILFGIALVAIFKRINKYALFFAMVIWNIWTTAPLYWLSYEIGEAIFGDAEVIAIELGWLEQAFDYTFRFMVGNLMLSIPISVSSYFLIKWLLKNMRATRDAS